MTPPSRSVRSIAALSWTALLTILTPVQSDAQGFGGVSGRVFDQTGAVLPGVTIDLVVNGTELTATTNVEGRYEFSMAPPGRAELTYRLINFTVLRRRIEIAVGAPSTLDATLSLSMNADIVVTGTRTFRNIADVENPAENLVGVAASASQGAITAEQLESRPIMRPGEVLETVPGMIISQHSGEGKANQYYLRGFNLDHGTDFSSMVAGVPVNTPTGAHAHGYADLGFLIPELVSGVQFKKGPYFADEGDFSAAGAANISYVNDLERPTISLSVGNDTWRRIFAAASPVVARGHMLFAVELNQDDGPWTRPGDYRKASTVIRYSRGNSQDGFSITGMGHWADWNSSDQVPNRAITSGSITRFGSVDPSDAGITSRQSLALEVQRSPGNGTIRASAYVLRNSLNLFSNFTYFLDDPENGDQFEQAERRITAGGRATYRQLGHFFDRHAESAVGVQLRKDRLSPIGLYHTAERQRLSTTREDEVGQTMLAVYGQTEIEWTRWLRTTLGLRADRYQFDVTAGNPVNSGNGADALASPKFSAVFGPWAGTEFYANTGMGFHSNDARGAVISVDPASGEPVGRVTPLVRARGAEIGMRSVRVRGLQTTVSLWYLGIDSELLFVGDAGTTEASRPSRRYGVEWTNYFRPRSWLTLDGDFSFTRAHFRDDDPAGDAIPGSLQRVISGGITFEAKSPVFGSLRVRHFGPRPLTEDRTVVSDSTTLWNVEAGYRISRIVSVVLEAYNLFDAEVSDIDYFYTSRLPGEADEGIDDIHTHPAPPRSFRVGLQFAF